MKQARTRKSSMPKYEMVVKYLYSISDAMYANENGECAETTVGYLIILIS